MLGFFEKEGSRVDTVVVLRDHWWIGRKSLCQKSYYFSKMKTTSRSPVTSATLVPWWAGWGRLTVAVGGEGGKAAAALDAVQDPPLPSALVTSPTPGDWLCSYTMFPAPVPVWPLLADRPQVTQKDPRFGLWPYKDTYIVALRPSLPYVTTHTGKASPPSACPLPVYYSPRKGAQSLQPD